MMTEGETILSLQAENAALRATLAAALSRIALLEEEVAGYQTVMEELQEGQAEFEKLKQTYDDLLSRWLVDIDELDQHNHALQQQVQSLLQLAQGPSAGNNSEVKTSKNSDIPSSKDVRYEQKKKTKKSDEASAPVGGQPGHQGHTLAIPTSYDEKVVVDSADHCVCCGGSLEGQATGEVRRRYVIEPVLTYKVICIEGSNTTCSCGHVSSANFPDYAKAPVQYGAGVTALASYLNWYHHIPYKRLSELFNDLFSLPISVGTLYNQLQKVAKQGNTFYEDIQQYLSYVRQVGSDETFFYLNGKRGYFWTWNTSDSVFIHASDSRKGAVIEELFPNGFPLATLVSDRYAAQLGTPAAAHQACLVHLDRRFVALQDSEQSVWAAEMQQLFFDAIALKDEVLECEPNDAAALHLEQRLSNLLTVDIDATLYPESVKLQRMLLKQSYLLFPFLYDKEVPWHNNASERDIRNVKIKLKVSGQFKSLAGAQTYAAGRSIIGTLKKNACSVLEGLAQIIRDGYPQVA